MLVNWSTFLQNIGHIFYHCTGVGKILFQKSTKQWIDCRHEEIFDQISKAQLNLICLGIEKCTYGDYSVLLLLRGSSFAGSVHRDI